MLSQRATLPTTTSNDHSDYGRDGCIVREDAFMELKQVIRGMAMWNKQLLDYQHLHEKNQHLHEQLDIAHTFATTGQSPHRYVFPASAGL
jgi:hypothetical protein